MLSYLVSVLHYNRNSRWHLQTNFPAQLSALMNTLYSTALLYSTNVFLPLCPPLSLCFFLLHPLHTSWSRHLFFLPLIIIHISAQPPSLSHLLCSSSRSILFHLVVPTSLHLPHTHHTPEVITEVVRSGRTDSWSEMCGLLLSAAFCQRL